VVTKANKVYSFGWNNSGELGIGNTTQKNTPTLVNKTFNGNIIDIS